MNSAFYVHELLAERTADISCSSVWLAQEVLDERHGGGDEAVSGDGLAVGTGAGLDVERPAAAGRGGQAGGREGGAVTGGGNGGADGLK